MKSLSAIIFAAFITGACACETTTGGASAGCAPFGDGRAFSPEALGMPRSRIIQKDTGIRVFNGRGAAMLQEKTLTGVQKLEFPPVRLPTYRFLLSFRDDQTGALIRDANREAYEYELLMPGRTRPGPLGVNLFPELAMTLLPQRSEWRPNEFFRTGTFHKRLRGKLFSFAMETRTRASHSTDEIFLEVKIHNRGPAPLTLTVLPEQTLFELELPPAEGIEVKPPRRFSHPDAYTLESGGHRVKVLSNLPRGTDRGWRWVVAAGQEETAYFSLFVRPAGGSSKEPDAQEIQSRMEDARRKTGERLEWAARRLPSVRTANHQLDELYYRSILTILELKWERPDFVTRPFYAIGDSWNVTISWDLSFLSRVMSLLDPDAFRQTLLLYVRAGLMEGTWIRWDFSREQPPGDDEPSRAYAQNLYAALQTIMDYILQTGDEDFLDVYVSGKTVFEWIKAKGRKMVRQHGQPNGLLNFGSGTRGVLETRVDDYSYIVGTTNGLMAEYFRQVADWCRVRKDVDAGEFEGMAEQIEEQLHARFWNEKEGWFENESPDGAHHLVWSYHEFDLLQTRVLTESQRRRMISQIRDGVFLGPYGMYSVARNDLTHWDRIDADFGGGGQYLGMSMRIVESLFASGNPQIAWDVLLRCAQWSSGYPYLPQEIYSDDMSYPDVVEQSLHINGGSAAQAILFGGFGLRPQFDGTLEVSPAYHPSLGDAWMRGYRFRGHSYDVHMTESYFEVYRDGTRVAKRPYSGAVRL